MFGRKDKNVVIINSGGHLPEVTIEQELRFLSERDRFVKLEIENQARNTGNIIYGGKAVNALVGPMYERPTVDFDIQSKHPKKHAMQLERIIDNHVGADISHIEMVSYDRDGSKGKMYRVALKNFDTIADYNLMPKNSSFVTKDGIRYEPLEAAVKKYLTMIQTDETKRLPNANQDLDRIGLYKYWKKIFR